MMGTALRSVGAVMLRSGLKHGLQVAVGHFASQSALVQSHQRKLIKS